ncbi:MAG: hypothetical protein ACR2NN_27785 [Bryobacteraceae bacterium]
MTLHERIQSTVEKSRLLVNRANDRMDLSARIMDQTDRLIVNSAQHAEDTRRVLNIHEPVEKRLE